MKKKTLYLHIGQRKTGTSSIQDFCYNNAQNLLEQKMLYPSFDAEEIKTEKSVILPDLSYVAYLYTKNYDEGIFKIKFNEISDQINNPNVEKIILSAEFFDTEKALIPLVNAILELGCNLKIIVYIRKPIEYLVLWWSEMVKNAWTKECVHEYLKQDFDLYSNIFFCIEKFGKDNVIIRPFEKSQWKNNNLIEDFANLIGLKLNDDFYLPPKKNQSWSRDKIEIKLLLNNILPDISNDFVYYRRLFQQSNYLDGRKLIETIDDTTIKEITDKYIPVLDEIAKIYGKEHLFDNYYPDCYGTEREMFDKITTCTSDLNILREAAEKTIEIRNNLISANNDLASENQEMRAEVDRLSQENQEMRRSIGYKIDRETRHIIKQIKNVITRTK